jgi:sugar phosphate isomerase/epimerase
MRREFMCSSHTVSGVMPGGDRAARHPLEERLRACSAAGYSGLWLHWRDYAAQKAEGRADAEFRDLFDRFGMRHRGVEFLTGWFLDGAAARDDEATAFAAAQATGAPVVNVGSDFAGRGIPRRQAISAFTSLCARAADRGIQVALEIVPWSDVPDVATALEFLEPANAGLVVDCWHIFRGGIPLRELTRIPAGRILCVQINDAAAEAVPPLAEDTLRRKLPGEGVFDLAGFRDMLDGAGARIPYSVEIIAPDFAALPADEAARLSFDAACRAFGGVGRSPAAGTVA